MNIITSKHAPEIVTENTFHHKTSAISSETLVLQGRIQDFLFGRVVLLRARSARKICGRGQNIALKNGEKSKISLDFILQTTMKAR